MTNCRLQLALAALLLFVHGPGVLGEIYHGSACHEHWEHNVRLPLHGALPCPLQAPPCGEDR